MDPGEFKAAKAGRIVTTPEGVAAFVPAPLPPKLAFSGELAVALSRADAALGALSGLGAELPDPAGMAAPFLRQEALCSTRIEGADVSLTEVLLNEVAAALPGSRLDEIEAVRNALATLLYGVESVARSPLDLDLLRDLHARLLAGEPATARTPGEFRTTQNWVGPPGSTLATATYVPPPVPQMRKRLDQLEGFMAERGRLPDIVQCALLHAQFQSIHPFVGGNGRLGRALIVLFLMERGRLSQPLLYLSAFLEAHRREYYALLQRVRTRGDWLPWLRFFADAVRETAEHAFVQTQALLHERARYRTQCPEPLLPLVDELLIAPFLSPREVMRVLDASDGRARRALDRLVSLGLLEPVEGTARPRVFVAQPILDAIEEPFEALAGETEQAVEGEPQKSWLGWDRRPRRVADRLMSEAMALVDTARAAGVDVRIAGGLAVRRHCIDLEFMDREYSDIDFVGRSEQKQQLRGVFTDHGYIENRFVSRATEEAQLMFVRTEKVLAAQGRRAAGDGGDGEKGPGAGEPGGDPQVDDAQSRVRPIVDHVDVFLDVMRMDHDLDVSGRLELDDYAISPADALVAKAQIGRINQKDVHDIIALVKDMPLRETDDDLSVCVTHIAELCAGDWGLYTDITHNLRVVADWAGDYGLSDEEAALVRERVATLLDAIESADKTRRWHLRARVGKRVAWRNDVEGVRGDLPVVIERGDVEG